MALHEVGHSLGLPDNTEPKSVMRGWYKHPTTNDLKVYTRPTLSKEDIDRIQALYGKNTGNKNSHYVTLCRFSTIFQSTNSELLKISNR